MTPQVKEEALEGYFLEGGLNSLPAVANFYNRS